MSLPVLPNAISYVTGQFDLFFHQMGSGRSCFVSILKEPLKIINNSGDNIFDSYGQENQNITDITYKVRSGIFECVPIYTNAMNIDKFVSMKFNLDLNSMYIKLKEDGASYIMDGTKTERVYVDGIPYIPQNTPKIQNFFGLRYYYFKLNEIQ